MTKPIIAIAYDFDGTLSPDYMQHHSFLPGLGIKEPYKEFWDPMNALAREQDMDGILAYMFMMLREANYKNMSIKREAFVEHGKGIQFFPGVETWFEQINAYGAAKGIEIQHYVISSGLREIIEGTSIYQYLNHVYASGFMYNQDGIAVWPATAVNYTSKTQHLFRINKGIPNSWDNESVNKYVLEEDRTVPFSHMIYIGDGETDIPAMKMTRHNGGTAISVYNPLKKGMKEASDLLIPQQRADHSFVADYTEGSEMDVLIKRKINDLQADLLVRSAL